MGALPTGATATSRRLLVIAERLADLCPLELGREIALTGSVSRGWANRSSDIELNFWVDKLDSPAAREAWLREIGAREVRFYPDAPRDAPLLVKFNFDGAAVDTEWQTFERCEAQLGRIFAGRPIESDMAEGFVTEALHHSIVLRPGEHLEDWKLRLRHYPDVLRRMLVREAAARWSSESRWFDLTTTFARRPGPSALIQRYDLSIRAILPILFAVNRQWEPELRKWTRRWVENLEVKPDRLADRIFAIYEQPLAKTSWPALLRLIGETLQLVPADIDISQSAAAVEKAMKRHSRA